ncbi:MAG: hypothetical protein K9L30_04985 [Desulfobacterales bacterium]|nr:hypothetical protein [Desulfobacterales bacterium]
MIQTDLLTVILRKPVLKSVYRKQLENRHLTEKQKETYFLVLKSELESYTYLSEK